MGRGWLSLGKGAAPGRELRRREPKLTDITSLIGSALGDPRGVVRPADETPLLGFDRLRSPTDARVCKHRRPAGC